MGQETYIQARWVHTLLATWNPNSEHWNWIFLGRLRRKIISLCLRVLMMNPVGNYTVNMRVCGLVAISYYWNISEQTIYFEVVSSILIWLCFNIEQGISLDVIVLLNKSHWLQILFKKKITQNRYREKRKCEKRDHGNLLGYLKEISQFANMQ